MSNSISVFRSLCRSVALLVVLYATGCQPAISDEQAVRQLVTKGEIVQLEEHEDFWAIVVRIKEDPTITYDINSPYMKVQLAKRTGFGWEIVYDSSKSTDDSGNAIIWPEMDTMYFYWTHGIKNLEVERGNNCVTFGYLYEWNGREYIGGFNYVADACA